MFYFVDTEFTDFIETELMSIGIVSEDGKHEFYAEVNSYTPEARSQFVIDVVVPLMEPAKYGRPYKRVASDLAYWINELPEGNITFVFDYIGDFQLMNELFGVVEPSRKSNSIFLGAGFDQMLVERGIHLPHVRFAAQQAMLREQEKYFTIDVRRHHALVDAKANCYGWVKGYEYAWKSQEASV